MSALLLLFYWVVLPVIVFLFFRMLWRQTQTNLQKGVLVAAGIFCAMGLIWILGGGAQGRLDRQVKELCAKDGGVKVYETVRLPAEKFDKWGMVKLYSEQRVENKSAYRHDDKQTVLEYMLGQEYIYRWVTTYYRKGNPEIWRDHYRVIRRHDGKLLGESISYSRRGGDLPGPWHPSSFSCPKDDIGLIEKIFIRTEKE